MSAETRFGFKVEKPTKSLYGKCWVWTETNLTQKQIGDNLGMYQAYVSRIINKKSRINY